MSKNYYTNGRKFLQTLVLIAFPLLSFNTLFKTRLISSNVKAFTYRREFIRYHKSPNMRKHENDFGKNRFFATEL